MGSWEATSDGGEKERRQRLCAGLVGVEEFTLGFYTGP